MDELVELLEIIYLETQSILFMDDINIYNTNTVATNHFKSIIDCFHLVQIVNKLTRITQSGELLIDVICPSKHLKLFNVDAIDIVCNTDRLLICCSVLSDSENNAPKPFVHRYYSRFNFAYFLFNGMTFAPMAT